MNRTRSFAVSLTALAVAAVVIPLSARGQLSERKGSAGAIAAGPEKNPYAALFITQDKQKPDTQNKSPEIVQGVPGRVPPRVVCGMTVFQADPDVDPKILQKPVRGDVDYKIKSMTSPICR